MDIKCFILNNHYSDKTYLFPTLRICQISSGEGIWRIGDVDYHCRKGDIILLNNLTSRRILQIDAAPFNINVIEFSPFYIQHSPRLIQAFYDKTNAIVKSEITPVIEKQIEALNIAYYTLSDVELCSHQLRAVLRILEKDTKTTDIPNGIHVAIAATDFICKNYTSSITVESVAKHLYISKTRLEQIFKSVFNLCVGEYITAIRVFYANKLLKEDSRRSVLDIALSCGFGSSSGFYKAYKRVTGSVPRRKSEL